MSSILFPFISFSHHANLLPSSLCSTRQRDYRSMPSSSTLGSSSTASRASGRRTGKRQRVASRLSPSAGRRGERKREGERSIYIRRNGQRSALSWNHAYEGFNTRRFCFCVGFFFSSLSVSLVLFRIVGTWLNTGNGDIDLSKFVFIAFLYASASRKGPLLSSPAGSLQLFFSLWPLSISLYL